MSRLTKKLKEEFNLSEYKGCLWEALPFESANHFRYFLIYRDLEGDRKHSEVCSLTGMEAGNLSRISTENYWKERVQAFDAHIANEKMKARIKAIQEMEKRHIEHSRFAAHALMLPIQTFVKSLSANPDKLKEACDNDPKSFIYYVTQSAHALDKLMNAERIANNQATEIINQNIQTNERVVVVTAPLSEDKKKEMEDAYKSTTTD